MGGYSIRYRLPDSDGWKPDTSSPMDTSGMGDGMSLNEARAFTGNGNRVLVLINGGSSKYLIDDFDKPGVAEAVLDQMQKGMRTQVPGATVKSTGKRRIEHPSGGTCAEIIFTCGFAEMEFPGVIRVFFSGWKWAMVVSMQMDPEAETIDPAPMIRLVDTLDIQRSTGPFAVLGVVVVMAILGFLFWKFFLNRPAKSDEQKANPADGTISIEQWRRGNRPPQ